MRRVRNSALFVALLLGLIGAAKPSSTLATPQDSNWSVLIVTEKGNCDPAIVMA